MVDEKESTRPRRQKSRLRKIRLVIKVGLSACRRLHERESQFTFIISSSSFESKRDDSYSSTADDEIYE